MLATATQPGSPPSFWRCFTGLVCSPRTTYQLNNTYKPDKQIIEALFSNMYLQYSTLCRAFMQHPCESIRVSTSDAGGWCLCIPGNDFGIICHEHHSHLLVYRSHNRYLSHNLKDFFIYKMDYKYLGTCKQFTHFLSDFRSWFVSELSAITHYAQSIFQ